MKDREIYHSRFHAHQRSTNTQAFKEAPGETLGTKTPLNFNGLDVDYDDRQLHLYRGRLGGCISADRTMPIDIFGQ
jgi:hypothetical protein